MTQDRRLSASLLKPDAPAGQRVMSALLLMDARYCVEQLKVRSEVEGVKERVEANPAEEVHQMSLRLVVNDSINDSQRN